MGRLRVATLVTTAVFLVSCAQGNCRRRTEKPLAPTATKSGEMSAVNDKRVHVYKNDGSKQCGMGQAIGVNEMAQELGDIKIFSRINRHDGLMHIQACGTPTGNINIYEIPEKDLAKAKSKGFSLWREN